MNCHPSLRKGKPVRPGYALANPYTRRLARRGIQLGNYFGVMHPPQTNYIALIAGELCNVTSDNRPPLPT
jgi:hypothetical protein